MQGFNMGRYYPPDASNPPAFNQTSHPLGKRANKLSQGILTVRFELPFAVWCDHCTPAAIIGQGVRFNAQKKKVGNYYSTPIWSFRMKHGACGGWWEIRTDPKNSEYVVVEGARRRDYGEDKGAELDGELRFLTEAEREKRREDAFAGLEGKLEEKTREKGGKERVEELLAASEVWRDPYDENAKLRRGFRAERKVLQREEKKKEGMKDKFSLGIEIADETEGDRARAKMVDFGVGKDEESWKPLFDKGDLIESSKVVLPTKKAKHEASAQRSKQKLQSTLLGNTRAAIDPFYSTANISTSKPTFAKLKRKRDTDDDNDTHIPNKAATSGTHAQQNHVALVGYDSD